MGKKKRPGFYSQYATWHSTEQDYYNTKSFLPANSNNNTTSAFTQQQYPSSTIIETTKPAIAATTTTTTTALNSISNPDDKNSSNNDSKTIPKDVSPIIVKLSEKHDEDNLPVVTKFKSSKKFYLNHEDDAFQERTAQISKGRAHLSPYDLTTKQTVAQLRKLPFADLIFSAKMIFTKTDPHIRINREKQLAYYNWVIVDLCRRMDFIQNRIIRRHGSRSLDLEMRSVIETLFDNPHISGISPTSQPHCKTKSSIYATITQNGEYVDFFTPFVEYKRSQVLDVVDQFGDEICLFTEFIDMKQIGDMDEKEYQDFVHDLNLCKDALKPRIENLSVVFNESKPIAAFDKMTLLNPD